jgi:hypothetical protein
MINNNIRTPASTLEKIKIMENKIIKMNKKMEILFCKHVGEYATKLVIETNLDYKNKLKCVEISDTHYSNGYCKRRIVLLENKQTDENDYIGLYEYWYTDSTIYVKSQSSNDGIQVETCYIDTDHIKNIDAKSFFDEIDEQIDWDYIL